MQKTQQDDKIMTALTTGRNSLKLIVWTFFELVIAYLFFGFYYGWLDDVTITHFMKGTFTAGVGICDFYEQWRGLSKIICVLDNCLPHINWYGWTLILCEFLTVLQLNMVLKNAYRPSTSMWFYFFSFCIFISAIHIHFIQASFTRASILLGSISVLALIINSSNGDKKSTFVFPFCCFIFAYFIRYEVLFLLPLFIVFWGLSWGAFNNALKIFGYIAVIVLLHLTLERLLLSPDKESHDTRWHLITEILDADKFENKDLQAKVAQGDLRMEALAFWFFQDKNVLTADYLKRVSSDYHKSFKYSMPWLYAKIKDEFFRAVHEFDHYNVFLNWGSYFIFIIALFTLSFLLFFIQAKDSSKSQYLLVICFIALFLFSVVAIAVAFKMEDRFALPYLSILCISLILWLYRKFKEDSQSPNPLIMVSLFTVLFLAGFIRSYEIASLKSSEEKKRMDAIALALPLMKEKKVVFDLWSMGVFYKPILQDQTFETGKNWLVWGEFFANENGSYRLELRNRFGADDIQRFYFCLAKDPDALFIFTRERKSLLENYLKQFYNTQIEFVEIEQQPFDKIKHNFLPYECSIMFYKIKYYNFLYDCKTDSAL